MKDESGRMILPRELQGKSSIRYVKPEDAGKPKLQTYRIFVDEILDLGHQESFQNPLQPRKHTEPHRNS